MPPLKRSEYLQQLSRDHHYSLLFCWKLKQGINHGTEISRIARYIAYFWPAMLLPHFEEEEKTLFVYSDTELTKQGVLEHRQIRHKIENIIENPDKTSYKDLLNLAEAVDLHVRFEERTLFPFLETALTELQLKAVGAAINASVPVADEFEDHFWEKK